LLQRLFVLALFLVTLSGQSRLLLGTSEMKFARIVTHMQILLNGEFSVRN
jgi:hypothetical protein